MVHACRVIGAQGRGGFTVGWPNGRDVIMLDACFARFSNKVVIAN